MNLKSLRFVVLLITLALPAAASVVLAPVSSSEEFQLYSPSAAPLGSLADPGKTSAFGEGGLFTEPLESESFLGSNREQSRFLLEVQLLIDRGDVAQAQERVEQLVRLNPKALWPRRLLAWVQIHQGLYREAEATAASILDLDKLSKDALFIQGYCAVAQKRYAQAVTIYDDLAASSPTDALAWLRLAWLHRELGQKTRAARALQRAEGAQRVRDALLVQMIQVAIAIGQDDVTERLLRRRLNNKPDSAETWSELGTVLFRTQRRTEAVAAYRKALELRPDEPGTLANLGASLATLDQDQEALEVLTRSLDLRVDQPDAWHNFLLLVDRTLASSPAPADRPLSDWEKEQIRLEQEGVDTLGRPQLPMLVRLRQNMNDSSLHRAVGGLVEQGGHPRAALNFYCAALYVNPADGAALSALEELLGRNREAAWKESLANDWRAAAEPETATNLSLVKAAVLEQVSGNPERAADYLARAYAHEPGNVVVALELGRAYAMAERMDALQVHMAGAAERFPDDGRVWFRYGRILLDASRTDSQVLPQAREVAERADQLTGHQNFEVLHLLHSVYRAQGEDKLAEQVAHDALALAEARERPDIVERIRQDLAERR